jgi:hypothetical protein
MRALDGEPQRRGSGSGCMPAGQRGWRCFAQPSKWASGGGDVAELAAGHSGNHQAPSDLSIRTTIKEMSCPRRTARQEVRQEARGLMVSALARCRIASFQAATRRVGGYGSQYDIKRSGFLCHCHGCLELHLRLTSKTPNPAKEQSSYSIVQLCSCQHV